tara:strand:+ start:532 stop:1071 length:540 start_codon:yes stop_codon:yes gene_type:complete
MEPAENFPDLAKNYAAWFVQALMPAIKFAEINPEEMFKNRKSVKAGALKIFEVMIKERYTLFPDDEAEGYLNEVMNFDYGVVGFILDILFIETALDESNDKYFGCSLFDMPNKIPTAFEVFIGSMSHEILQSLLDANIPDQLLFGDIEKNKTFQKKLKNDDYSDLINFFAKKYSKELKE